MAPAKPKSSYIETDTGNKVARRAQLHGTQHIILGGRTVIQPNVCIRGDLISPPSTSTTTSSTTTTITSAPSAKSRTSISIGRYTFISTNSILRPASRISSNKATFIPMKIGDHVMISPNCVIEAASIGDHCHIGENVVVGAMCIVKDYVKVLEGAVLPRGMVVPSFSVVGGRPARVLGEVGEGWGVGEGEGGDLREVVRGVGLGGG